MSRYYETPDVDRERMPPLQGVCKDCNSGTLNNELNPAFDVEHDGVYCKRCGSNHVDCLAF